MIINSQIDVPYLPLPNKVDIWATSVMAPDKLTRTSFMVPLMPNGDVVLANNRRRGVEIPGGHIDPGETQTKAAVRECVEETGCWVSWIKPIGYLEMKSEGTVPPDWKYPHPLGYQQFFAGIVQSIEHYVENDECLAPVTMTYEQACETLPAGRLALYREARRVMGF